ncbi:Uncharacterised protein [Klebsiella quasipneumoniae]|nr:Uncharacterised protein [Klebsiella quasipneumoniae]VGB31864.1 Uncharacterised protein [Klebsiella quasipneumoniae]VGB76382.1 Uncharacterised protein [Klebsiella quasipneumoniae]
MTRWVSCCPASPLDKKASQPVNRCHNATFVFSSVGKRIAWVYFNHSWPGAGNINSEFAILAGAYYARSRHPHPLSGGKEGRSAVVAAPLYTAGPQGKAHTIFNGYVLIAMKWLLKPTGVQRARFPLKSANRRSADKGWPPWTAARGDSRHDVELSRPQADDREVSVVRSTDFSAGPGGL